MKRLSLLIITIFLFFTGCSRDIEDMANEPSFTGIISEVHENYLLVKVDENEDEYSSSDVIIVSLNMEIEDNSVSYNVGDSVRVYYDGNILESYPAQVNNVYTITLM